LPKEESMMKPGSIYRKVFLILAVLIFGLGSALPTLAHSHVYWPQSEGCYAKPGELVKWQYFWGHPFEMLISDAQTPKFFMFTPQRKKENLTAKDIALKDQESGQDRKAFRWNINPLRRETIFFAWKVLRILSRKKRNSGRTT
jgi:hypothetical protein